jgi:hypothetical protein
LASKLLSGNGLWALPVFWTVIPPLQLLLLTVTLLSNSDFSLSMERPELIQRLRDMPHASWVKPMGRENATGNQSRYDRDQPRLVASKRLRTAAEGALQEAGLKKAMWIERLNWRRH